MPSLLYVDFSHYHATYSNVNLNDTVSYVKRVAERGTRWRLYVGHRSIDHQMPRSHISDVDTLL